MTTRPHRAFTLTLAGLLGLLVVRLWLMPLGSSFWVDETETAFLVRYGAAHWSMAVMGPLSASIYYVLPRAADALAGFSEIAYRIPSTLALLAALALIAGLARRLIHAEAGWLVVFLCMGMRGFSFQAADARPYALGTAVMCAAMWFLVRWLDSTRWPDAAGFVISGALLWWVQPVYLPFCAVFFGYAIARITWKETRVSWPAAAAVFGALLLLLIPEALHIRAWTAQAETHVIAANPSARELFYALGPGVILTCGIGVWLCARILRVGAEPPPVWRSSIALFILWWCWVPLSVFAFAHVSGLSLFVPRYLSLALPGTAMLGAFLIVRQVPPPCWKPATLLIGAAVLLFAGQWHRLWPEHAHADWRGASAMANQLAADPAANILCPSPFFEGKSPVWHPDYPLPAVLYAPLAIYPLRGTVRTLPRVLSPEAEQYAAALVQSTLAPAGRFLLYTHRDSAGIWTAWLRRRPELSAWSSGSRGDFGDVLVIEFLRNSR